MGPLSALGSRRMTRWTRGALAENGPRSVTQRALSVGAVAGAAVIVTLAAACSGAGDDASPPRTQATGALGAWTTLEPMTQPRNNFCAVVASGYLVAIGGNDRRDPTAKFVDMDAVHIAKLRDDGSVEPWSLAGHTPSTVSSCTATADGHTIWLVDGIYGDAAHEGSVRKATLTEDGTLSEFAVEGTLPEGTRVLYASAWVDARGLFAFTAKLPDQGDALVLLHAPIASDGSLGAFTETVFSPGFRGHPQYAHVTAGGGAEFAYALGGYAGASRDNVVLSDGAGVALDADGVPGATFPTTLLPLPTNYAKSTAVDRWVFLTGGSDALLGGTYRPDVIAARVTESGQLGEWNALEPLPEGRVSHAVVAHGDWLYVLGGSAGKIPEATVFAARVRFPRP